MTAKTEILTTSEAFTLGQMYQAFTEPDIDTALNMPERDGHAERFAGLFKRIFPIIDEMNARHPDNDVLTDESGDVYHWFADRCALAVIEWASEEGIDTRTLVEHRKTWSVIPIGEAAELAKQEEGEK